MTLLEMRRRTRLTQQQVADVLGIKRATYSHIETQRRRCKPSLAAQLAKLYGVPYGEVVSQCLQG